MDGLISDGTGELAMGRDVMTRVKEDETSSKKEAKCQAAKVRCPSLLPPPPVSFPPVIRKFVRRGSAPPAALFDPSENPRKGPRGPLDGSKRAPNQHIAKQRLRQVRAGASWGPLGAVLGPSWSCLGALWGPSEGF